VLVQFKLHLPLNRPSLYNIQGFSSQPLNNPKFSLSLKPPCNVCLLKWPVNCPGVANIWHNKNYQEVSLWSTFHLTQTCMTTCQPLFLAYDFSAVHPYFWEKKATYKKCWILGHSCFWNPHHNLKKFFSWYGNACFTE